MLLGHEGAVPSRLIAAAYRDEQEAAERVAKLGSSIDVCLFTGPSPYEVARRSGVLSVPATYVPLGGAALYSALLRAATERDCDLTRVSIDVLSRAEVEEAYADLGLDTANVHVREDSAAADFHEQLWRTGTTTMALTCVHTVARQLRDAAVPTLEVRPTTASIRSALNTAALLGAASQLETAQIAIGIVDIPTLRETSQPGSSRYWREELKLTVHRLLLDEARTTGLLLWSNDDHSYLTLATVGSFASATRGFRAPPFVERIRDELGISVEVGIGLGTTAQDAEAHARAALSWSHRSRGRRGFVVDRTGRALPVAAQEPARRDGSGAEPKGLDVLARLILALEKSHRDNPPVIVDAEITARSLGVTQRTARRLLRGLVEDGLAWPLPPNRTPQPGRPRQLYRLIREKLDT
ncbi:MAG: transcriptional regulator [Streptosporangiales bacterium]|nr:transcriptional regulator [Streptosporangiales bacterium]